MGETAAADLTAVGLAEHERRIRVAAIRAIAAAKSSHVGPGLSFSHEIGGRDVLLRRHGLGAKGIAVATGQALAFPA